MKNGILNLPESTRSLRDWRLDPSKGRAPHTSTYSTTPRLWKVLKVEIRWWRVEKMETVTWERLFKTLKPLSLFNVISINISESTQKGIFISLQLPITSQKRLSNAHHSRFIVDTLCSPRRLSQVLGTALPQTPRARRRAGTHTRCPGDPPETRSWRTRSPRSWCSSLSPGAGSPPSGLCAPLA